MQPPGGPHVDSVLRAEGSPSAVDEYSPHQAREFGDGAQARQQCGVIARLRLDLDRREFLSTAKEKVHLGGVRGMGGPVMEIIVRVGLRAMCPEEVKNPSFEEGHALFPTPRTPRRNKFCVGGRTSRE